MAENWTHDRPPARPSKGRNRRMEPQRARLELPMPVPHEPRDEGAAPSETPQERGVAQIDFYV